MTGMSEGPMRCLMSLALGLAWLPWHWHTTHAESSAAKIFQGLFEQRRAEHRAAVKTILNNRDTAKQQKMVNIITSKAFEVLEQSQVRLREASYVPGMAFPEEQHVREALSQTLENTAFLGELLLRLPLLTHQLLQHNKQWQLILEWGIFFATQSKFIDKKSATFFYLVSQELGVAERDPNYTNPYAQHPVNQQQDDAEDTTHKATAKKKKKKFFRKGPQLSRQFGDL